jgi:protein-L-isoaspartate(D-aspartate) O-methyltransferase
VATAVVMFLVGGAGQGVAIAADSDAWQTRREEMVTREIEAAGVEDPRVLAAVRATPRHEFVPAGFRAQAYLDAALPIGEEQTISPPFVVAYMTEQLRPQPTDRVLEIGTGSGYQAAILSPLVKEVYTIEIVPRLGHRAIRTLERLGYKNVHVRVGDGYQGWPEHAPFDKIIVTCSPEKIPPALVEQLVEGGQLIIPVGERYQQNLIRVTKRQGELIRESLRATLFVPMTGAAESRRNVLPDPKHPKLANAGFERAVGSSRLPEGWHYLRSAQLVTGDDAPEGTQFLRFDTAQAGSPSRALQGLGLDGRAVSRLKLTAHVRGEGLRAGPTPDQQASILVTFYDERRAVIGNVRLGPWRDTFEWREVSAVRSVPLATREAIVRLGLHGGVGRLDVDQVRLEATD